MPDDRAVEALADILEDSSLDMEVREQAIFWFSQTESDEAFAYIDRILTSKLIPFPQVNLAPSPDGAVF